MLFTFMEDKRNFLNMKYSLYLLFLTTVKFYISSWIWAYFILNTGECFVSRVYWNLKICKYV